MNTHETDPTAILERLFEVIREHRDGDPAHSYVASLSRDGLPRMAQKLGEEAVETVVAALAGGRRQTIDESADLLFHLMVLWAELGITPGDVLGELARREGRSGHLEKRARGKSRQKDA